MNPLLNLYMRQRAANGGRIGLYEGGPSDKDGFGYGNFGVSNVGDKEGQGANQPTNQADFAGNPSTSPAINSNYKSNYDPDKEGSGGYKAPSLLDKIFGYAKNLTKVEKEDIIPSLAGNLYNASAINTLGPNIGIAGIIGGMLNPNYKESLVDQDNYRDFKLGEDGTLESGEARNPYATYEGKRALNPSELSRLEAAGIGLTPAQQNLQNAAAEAARFEIEGNRPGAENLLASQQAAQAALPVVDPFLSQISEDQAGMYNQLQSMGYSPEYAQQYVTMLG